MVRTRFAPSPTGYMHLGNLRSALYTYLYAKKHNGTFILRIEDTDQERSTDESRAVIFDSMKWLGLTWDEGPGAGGEHGPYTQMERLPLYKQKAEELIAAKKSVEEIREYIGADSLAFLSLDGLVESIGLGADAPYGGLCVAYFNGDYPTALDDYEADFLKSLTPEDRVRLPEFALYKSKYEGNEYTTTSSQEEH